METPATWRRGQALPRQPSHAWPDPGTQQLEDTTLLSQAWASPVHWSRHATVTLGHRALPEPAGPPSDANYLLRED